MFLLFASTVNTEYTSYEEIIVCQNIWWILEHMTLSYRWKPNNLQINTGSKIFSMHFIVVQLEVHPKKNH